MVYKTRRRGGGTEVKNISLVLPTKKDVWYKEYYKLANEWRKANPITSGLLMYIALNSIAKKLIFKYNRYKLKKVKFPKSTKESNYDEPITMQNGYELDGNAVLFNNPSDPTGLFNRWDILDNENKVGRTIRNMDPNTRKGLQQIDEILLPILWRGGRFKTKKQRHFKRTRHSRHFSQH